MYIEKICKLRDKIQNLVDSHIDDLQDIYLTCDAAYDNSEKILAEYKNRINPYKLLHVGIVGRVKAGKSSLLNALFFDGKNILPKAATPMTAALTKLYYSKTLSVKINFFDKTDIEELEKAYSKYEKLLKQKTEEKFQKQLEIFKKHNKTEPTTSDINVINDKAKKASVIDLKNNFFLLCGEAEQYELYKKSDSDVKGYLGKVISLNIDNINDLEDKLSDYVGANGKFTAITSNVEIGFPNESLENIVIVDTPGFDDPVTSRDALARDALKICDVIFILSPTGSFCNIEDRLNISKIEKGEGIQELFVIASQIDNQLCAPEYIKKDINLNIENIISKISGTLRSMLEGMLQEGLASKNLIDRLLDNSEKNLFFTSGICHTLYNQWTNKDSWDEEMIFIFNRLKQCYPDYLSSEDESSREVLKKIGNIETIKYKIKEIQIKKNDILRKRESDFLSVKHLELKDIIFSISEGMSIRKKEIEQGDIGELETERNKMIDSIENLKTDFIDDLDNDIEKFTEVFSTRLNERVSEYYQEKKADMKHAESSNLRTINYTIDVPYSYTEYIENSGFFSAIARILGIGGYHTETRFGTRSESRQENINVHTINAYAVTSAIKDFALSLGLNLEENAELMKTKFKKNLKSSMLSIWEKYNLVEYCSNSNRSILATQIVNTLPDISFTLNWHLPNSLSKKGHLEDDEAYAFENDAAIVLNELKISYQQSINDYIKAIRKSFIPSSITDRILEKMIKEVEKLSKQIENKKEVLYKFEKIQNEISTLKSEIEEI